MARAQDAASSQARWAFNEIVALSEELWSGALSVEFYEGNFDCTEINALVAFIVRIKAGME